MTKIAEMKVVGKALNDLKSHLPIAAVQHLKCKGGDTLDVYSRTVRGEPQILLIRRVEK